MTYSEFSILYFNQYFLINLSVYLSILILIFFIFKSEIQTLLDPIVLVYIIPLANCLAIIFWLFNEKCIKNSDFYDLMIINLSFIFSFRIGLKLIKINTVKKVEKLNFFRIFYSIHSLIFVVIFFWFLKARGIVGFSEKLSLYLNNIILVYFSSFFILGQIIIIFIKRNYYFKKNKLDFILLFMNLIIQILIGGKSAILNFLSTCYISFIIIDRIKNKKNTIIKKNTEKKLLIISTIGVYLMFCLTNRTFNFEKIFSIAVFRFLGYGDVYYLAYPNDIISRINYPSFNNFFILSLLGPLKKIFSTVKDPILGFEIIKGLYGIQTPNFGPNSRYDVILQLTVGRYFGAVYSIFLGILMALIRKKIFFVKSFLGIYIHIYLFMSILNVITDNSMFAANFFPLIAILPMIYIISLLAYSIFKK